VSGCWGGGGGYVRQLQVRGLSGSCGDGGGGGFRQLQPKREREMLQASWICQMCCLPVATCRCAALPSCSNLGVDQDLPSFCNVVGVGGEQGGGVGDCR
jgi:hypothetical protein